MEEIIEAKRDLGNGRWDRILKRKMVELSHADTYEEARDEWEATGRVYNHTHYGNEPEWTNGHTGHCLCGHPVVYHFEIRNTVTGVHECVGSDHIGAYLIIREIARDTGINAEDVTDVQIKTWLKDRVAVMKRDAWWAENGAHFTDMLNDIRELDMAVNIKDKSLVMNGDQYAYKYYPKTRATGKFGDYGYKMASIVWRWDTTTNPRNQLTKYGYPNDRLWSDINLFWALRNTYQPILDEDNLTLDTYQNRRDEQIKLQEERQRLYQEKRRLENIAWEEGREERERLQKIRQEEVREQRRLRDENRKNHHKKILAIENEHLDSIYDYYGMSPINTEEVLVKREFRSDEIRSLVVIKELFLYHHKQVDESHLRTLSALLGK